MLLVGRAGTALRAGYRTVTLSCVAAGLLVATSFSAIAAGGAYEPGTEIAGGSDAGYSWSTYAVSSDTYVYQYATDSEGTAWYNSYDGSEWSGWAYDEDQPAVVTYDPAPVYHNGSSYVFYTGDAGEMYYVTGTDSGSPAWTDIAGDYTFDSAPAASDYDGQVDLYATADDGYVYTTYSSGDGWAEWALVNDETSKGKSGSEPYAISWDGYDNVFWTSEDGTVYWNRYDGSTWTGPIAINGTDYSFDSAVYAVGYAPEEQLYAYAATSDGDAVWNVFDGDGWAGWQAYDVDWRAKGQPNAYVYDDAQHIVYGAADGHAYYNNYTANGYSADWQDLGENYAYGAQQYGYADGLYLTYTGEDGSVYYRTYSADGGPAVEPSDDSAYPDPSPSPSPRY